MSMAYVNFNLDAMTQQWRRQTLFFTVALYPMSGKMQLGDSKQNWRGTKLKTVRQISDAL